ncbi:hypothetical protein PV10_06851 [Exophiala mesophila]|uniref:LicD/FKTN/FKRP nucleotidyltransferase domain-containing protein n=1 Tax=Exophiala mesophila TaxID=212818 RepID=A0A0D1XMT1_EXOME|nr:uncharacterized protein PV10_06851 [Exophiala mesophila]KIV89451.1 hypothetical protein PV10_06851 [Exophiala mesophila]
MVFVAWRRRRFIFLSAVGLFLVGLTLVGLRRSSIAATSPLPLLPGTFQYFHEADHHYKTHRFGAISHFDARYVPLQQPTIDDVRRTLVALLKSYTATMQKLGAETWIAHGVLLGWHWNQKLLPWDTDIDVQMSAGSLTLLATSYNMSKHEYTPPGESAPRIYLLDINPHHTISSSRDVANKIDARWIDTTNGKYVDITAVHSNTMSTTDVPSSSSELFCKDGHRYAREDLFPLRESTLEDTLVKVPQQSAKILAEEYGKKSLTRERFHWHHFNQNTKTWEPE